MAVTAGAAAVAPVRLPTPRDFVRLKLRLLGNGLRGQTLRVVGFVFGLCFGVLFAGLAALGLAATGAASRDVGYAVAAFAGSAVVLSWTFVPLLFFGVDETLDPARFALLPIPRMTLARGMLAAAMVGVPPLVTLMATMGVAIAAVIRFSWLVGLAALVGVLAGLVLGVIASRAVTSAFASLLRSRRVRDLAAVLIALLASSVAPMQWMLSAAVEQGSIAGARQVADILAWTPLGAPYVLAFDVAEGRPALAVARLAITLATIGLLLWWWSRTIESAMLGSTGSSGASNPTLGGPSRGAVGALIPRLLRPVARPGVFGAILARESRFWWRDPRRRAGLLSILIASAVVPIALNLASETNQGSLARAANGLSPGGFTFAVSLAGVFGGMLLANQFGYDGNAFAAHLLAHVPGRVELRARAAAIAVVAMPVQLVVVIVVSFLSGSFGQLPAGLGLLTAAFGASIAAAALLSVLAPYAVAESTNPFAMNAGTGSAKGLLSFVAVLATGVISAPVVVASLLFAGTAYGAWSVGVLGLGYGVVTAWAGTSAAGSILDQRGPELLLAVSPKR